MTIDAGRYRDKHIWKAAAGVVLTLAVAGVLLELRKLGFNIPNPILVFADLIVLSGFLGGVRAGVASVVITLAFAVLYWSTPGHWLHYSLFNQKRLLVLALTMPPLGLLVGLLRSAYDRKQQQLVVRNEQLTNELKRREALEKTQQDVEHILRHDLRSPLGGIISIPTLLLDDVTLSAEQRKLLEMITASGRKMLGQINNSLGLRKIEDGSYTFEARPCDPIKIIKDNYKVLLLSGQTGTSPLQLVAETPLELKTDATLLDNIVANVLTNAFQGSDDGCPVLVEARVEHGDYIMAISNNRPVPEEIRQRFFEKYATFGKVGGTGLGTYSAALMTKAIGGTITMETAEQTGTTVTVRIPS